MDRECRICIGRKKSPAVSQHACLYSDLLQALKGQPPSSGFSIDGSLISAYAVTHCGPAKGGWGEGKGELQNVKEGVECHTIVQSALSTEGHKWARRTQSACSLRFLTCGKERSDSVFMVHVALFCLKRFWGMTKAGEARESFILTLCRRRKGN